MSRSLTISDELYQHLETTAKARGLDSIENLIAELIQRETVLIQHREAIDRINQRREQLFERYGEMLDSTDLIREDRDR
ncbi:MAG: hypothetical protein KME13_07700 [Myxacorys californica WJT36-NPBG1]|jgi:predicted CopG family antitoxin|nr:hypothetical protein [Myxacorys californica WJT36-NPBG1]